MAGVLLFAIALVGAEPIRLRPDPMYVPSVGDTVMLGVYDERARVTIAAMGAIGETSYEGYCKALKAADRGRIGLMEKRGQLVSLPVGTTVVIERLSDFPENDIRANAAFVKGASSYDRDKRYWVSRRSILLKIETRVALLLKTAQRLEKEGKRVGAIEYYALVVRDYADTPEGEIASGRIEALGGKTQAAPLAGRRPKRRYASQDAERQAVGAMMDQIIGDTVRAGSPVSPNVRQLEINRQNTMSHLCGAPTLDGTPCMRRVLGPGYCYQHRGY